MCAKLCFMNSVINSFVKRAPEIQVICFFALRDLTKAYYTRWDICKFKLILSILARQMVQVVLR